MRNTVLEKEHIKMAGDSSGGSTNSRSKKKAAATSHNETTEEESSASSSLEKTLGLSIPSHKHFSVMIHKHEIPRKTLHVSIGFLTLWLYTIGVQFQDVTPILATLFVGIASCDLIRFKYEEFNRLYIKVVGFLMREKEVSGFNGVIWYLLGLVIVFLLFPKDVSLLAVLLLSWADTAASTIGRAYGYLTPKIGSKSFAGSGSAFLMSSFSCWVLYSYFIPSYPEVNRPGDIMWSPETSKITYPWLILIAGVVGSISEAIDVFDDNLTIPVLSATLMWIIIKVGGN